MNVIKNKIYSYNTSNTRVLLRVTSKISEEKVKYYGHVWPDGDIFLSNNEAYINEIKDDLTAEEVLYANYCFEKAVSKNLRNLTLEKYREMNLTTNKEIYYEIY